MRFALRLLLVALVLAACSVDTIPRRLCASAPAGTGPGASSSTCSRSRCPTSRRRTTSRPSPIPTSRTGRRINASLVAPTRIERVARAQFDEMEGWGTYAPITVRFAPRARAPPAAQAAIDLEDVRLAHAGDGWDTTNDAVYVVNLDDGRARRCSTPGSGNFPHDRHRRLTSYYPNDPHARRQQPRLRDGRTRRAGACADGDYRPPLDLDFDGVLDHPNTLGAARSSRRRRQPHDLVRAPDRHAHPAARSCRCEEKTEYAVVAHRPARAAPTGSRCARRSRTSTTRADGAGGAAPGHPRRRRRARTTTATSPARASTHVAFAWTFTTQPVTRRTWCCCATASTGRGPFARFATRVPADVAAGVRHGRQDGRTPSDEPAGWQSDPAVPRAARRRPTSCTGPTRSRPSCRSSRSSSRFSPAQQQALVEALDDRRLLRHRHLRLAVPDGRSAVDRSRSDHFHVNFMTRRGRRAAHAGHFWMAASRRRRRRTSRRSPSPTGATARRIFDTEMVIHAGRYARQGIALASMDAPGHGLVLDAGAADPPRARC